VVSSAAAVAPCLLYLEDIEVLCSAHTTGLAASQVYVGVDSYCCVAEALHSWTVASTIAAVLRSPPRNVAIVGGTTSLYDMQSPIRSVFVTDIGLTVRA